MRILKSLCVGFSVVIILLVIGVATPRAEHTIDFILKPGDICATYVFGGLHGLEPLLMLFVVDALLFGMLFHAISWAVRKARHVGR